MYFCVGIRKLFNLIPSYLVMFSSSTCCGIALESSYRADIKRTGNNSTKTCLYNADLLKPYFYTVKLEYIIFLISVQNIDLGTH